MPSTLTSGFSLVAFWSAICWATRSPIVRSAYPAANRSSTTSRPATMIRRMIRVMSSRRPRRFFRGRSVP